jgi:uncharacterized protein (DUF1800 family)
MPLPEFTGTLGIKRASHLLRRATFGATKQDIDTFAGYTPTTATNALFRQTLPAPLTPVNPVNNELFTNLTDTFYAPDQMDGELQDAFKKWFIGQMLSSGVPANQKLAYSAREKIVFFLHTHFTAIQEKIGNSRSLYFQNVLYRLFALDAMPAPVRPNPLPPLPPYPPLVLNFKNLTAKVSVDNAMIALLDGNQNVKGNPNENYSRELLELYSIGRGLEGTLPPTTEQYDYFVYKELDVQEGARVLSGWEVDDTFSNEDLETGLPRARVRGSANNASAHDNDPKTFSNRLPGTITANPTLLNGGNPTEESALDEIRQLIDLIYAQPETAKNICRKLYRFFVYHEITPAIDSTIIEEMANTFSANGFKIQPVIENLLRSQHFYDAAPGVTDDAFGGIIKSPLELVIDTIRFFNVPIPDQTTNLTNFYAFTGNVLAEVDNQGMKFYQPFDVAGYEAYHQFPIYHRSWINVNYLTRRYDFIRNMLNPMSTSMLKANVYQFILDNFSAAAPNARQLVVALCEYFLPVSDNLVIDPPNPNSTITAERLNYFLGKFLTLDVTEANWTNRWNTGDPTEPLMDLLNAVLQSPEYQLH